MAGTRNKQMYSDFRLTTNGQEKLADWQTTEKVLYSPAYPCGVNVQKMPANRLSTNSVDIESSLYGIGSNNYVFPVAPTEPDFTILPTKQFYKIPDVYIPILPSFLQAQRP
jgi:hypothetical protein